MSPVFVAAHGSEIGAEQPNVHLPYDQQAQIHHRVVGALAAKYTTAGRVLDIGCGKGYTLEQLHALNPGLELVGADIDQVCLDFTRKRVPGVHVVQQRAEQRPGEELDLQGLGDGYDTCVMSHVLEHLLRPIDALRQVLGILKHGGHLVVAVPNPVRPHVFLLAALRRHYVNRGHVHSWDRSHWINFLERQAGLDVVEYASDEVRAFPESWKQGLRFLQRPEVALARWFPWWSFSNIAVIRKG